MILGEAGRADGLTVTPVVGGGGGGECCLAVLGGGATVCGVNGYLPCIQSPSFAPYEL